MRNKFTAFLFAMLLGLSTSVSAAVTYCAPAAFGYGHNATGGGSATPVLVSSVSQLQSALNKGKNKVIIITQSLTFTSMLSVQDGSNVTLLGLPGVTLTSLQQTSSSSGILYVKRFNNLIIRNLTFVGPGAYDCDGNDLLCFESVTNAWVDHCDFQDGCDGNFDNKKLSDNVTISWCRFRYLKEPKAGGSGGSDDHRFTNLLGSSSSDKPSDGTFNYTWAYCWWDNGCKERMVRCRNCELHFMNCYWNSSVANYYVGPENAKCYFEGCTFEGKANSSSKIFKSYGGTNACYFTDCSGNLPSNSGTVPNPHSSYTVTASGRAEAKTAVTNATCGAGATLTVTTAGVVSSTCDGGAPLPTVYTVTWNATSNGGSCGTATTSVTAGNAVGTLPEATKSGYNFDGWYTAPSGGTKISSSTTITGNVTYYAQFTSAPVTVYYTVIWDANGGTCATASSSIESGQAIGTLPVASKAGDYSFDGWYTAVNGGTKISTTTTVTANVTYYAHYTATGGGGGCSATLTHYGKQFKTNDPRRGYAYVGSTSGTKFIIESDNSNTKNVDADSSAIRLDYSKYLKVLGPGATTNIADSLFTGVTQISFKWKLYNSGSTTRTTTVDVYVGGTKVGNAIELTGLNSDGFQTHTISSIASLHGAVTIKNTGSGSSNKNLHFDDISITYSCTSTSYTLTYDENGGSGTMTAATGTSATVAANGFTAPTGYSFQEWNTEMNGGGTTKAVGATITLIEDMTLYAIWQPNTYTVTLNAEGGSGGSASVTATFDAALPNITIPTRDGYVFKGYYTGTDGTGTQYYDTNGSSTNDWTIAANTELHAYWETGSTPIVSGCDLHFWFVKEADATTNSKTNDGTFFSGMVTNSSSLSGSITIDGTSYSVTGRSGDAASFGSFTIPTGHAGTFYALAVSSGSGDRQINLNNGSDVYELPVAGGSSSYKRIESEELPAGTYTIEREGSSNVRLGIVVVKVCSTEPCTTPAAPTGFATTEVASTTATFSITDPADAASYDLYYASGSPATPDAETTATENVTTKTPTITGLAAATTYKIWVRAVCDATHKSAWVALGTTSFTTGKASPTSYTVGAVAEGVCAGGMTAKITLSGSQMGVNYQLKKGGVDDGAEKAGTGSALEWTGKGSGVYTIWAVANATYSGLQMSGTATVVVYDATAITTQPTISVSAETDESFTLGSGMVTAGHDLTYRWYTCSSTGTDTVFISGATSATYTASQSVANTYYYRVRVDGSCGDPVLSNVITVTITSLLPPSDAPTISVQPAGATYCATDPITALSVTATGSGTVTYQWKKDGVDIPSANSATYTPDASGTYACVVTNTEGGKTPTTLTSSDAVVTIKAAVTAPTMGQTDNTVTIATVTDGATIYYTTDGSDPTTLSASGTSVSIVADCTVKAYAVKDGCASGITSFVATYDPLVGAPCVTLITYTLTTNGTATPTIATDENNLVGGSADYSVSSTSQDGGYKLNSNQYFGLTLASGQFKAGDKVTVTITKVSDQGDKGLHLCTSKTGAAVLSIAQGDVVVGDNVFTLAADCDAIYVARNGDCAQNPYVKAISVCRKLIEYTVTFDKNDAAATGTMAPQSFYSTIASKINANTFALDGYDFAGWATSPSGSKVYDDKQSVTMTENLTLYALWQEETFTLTNEVSPAGYGAVDVASVGSIPSGTATSITDNTYTVNGTTVTATPAATTAQYTYAFDSWSGLPATVTADATVTANFTRTPRYYTVTLTTNGGTINAGNVTGYTYGTGATLPTDVTQTGGYEFAGWYDNSSLTGSPVTTIPDDATGDKAYWAKWILCPLDNSGETLYKFEVNSGVSDGNICSDGNNPRALTTPTDLSTLIGGTLEGYITNNSSWNNLTFASGRITYANNDRGVLILTLDCPIREGDLIRFNNYSSSNGKYNYLRHTSYSTSTDQLTLNASKSTAEIQQITAPAEFVGKTELFIVPGSRTTGISYFEIIRPCTLTLDAGTNGGTVGGNSTQVIYAANGDVLSLPHAFKDGYRFKGWYMTSSGGSPVSDPYTVSGATTLYAQFEDCPHDGTMYKFEVGTGLTDGAVTASGVAFEFTTANYLSSILGGTLTTDGSAANKVAISGNNAITITDNGAYLKIDLDCEIHEGDVFKSTVSGATVYVSKETSRTKTAELPIGTLTQTPIPAALVGEKTLYIWKGSGSSNALTYFEITRPKQTNITLNASGAYNHYTTSVVATYEQAMPEIAVLPVRTGYVFAGYYDQPNGAGTQYYNGLGVGVRDWDKDVITATLYANWKEPCELAPTLTNTVPVVTIWDEKAVDIALVQLSCDFDTTGIHYSLVSASEAITGCTFRYFDERIYIQGTPALGNASTVTKAITFTMTNDCSPASTYNVTATIRIYPASRKAKIAYIVTGTKGGGFNEYSSSDESSSSALLTYLRTFYDVDCVNGYATKDAAAIATYYDQYDLLIVTDYMETPEGYTNAIGTLIDKKPILSFEAYVAGEHGSNWHIGSNPKDPSPKVKDMKILCAGHAIFKDAEYVDVINDADTTVNVLSALSSSGKGLQGFVINEAPDYIFLATVRDANNNRDLIVCCERQVVFPARLLLYGINYYEMGNLSPAGKVVMHQMIEYLLMTDETKVADCSLVFDNGAGNTSFNPGSYSGTGTRGDGKWSTAANWSPGYNIVPTPYHPTRIIAECHVDVDNAHAGSVKVNQGRDEYGNEVDGKLIVEPEGGLTIAGIVAKVNDTRYASPITIRAEDLLIKANATHNGSFVYGNKESDVRATVEYYSRGADANTATPVWQYMGIPFQAGKTAISMFYAAWMCRWAEGSTDDLGGLWQWVDNYDVLVPFDGYCITQASTKTYTNTGKLNAPVTTVIPLDNRDAEGYAFAANSWTAPIKIQEMDDADFVNAEKAIYIYHSGTYASWNMNKENIINTDESAAIPAPGQYVVIPIHSSPYLGVDSVIPAMQGFFVKTTPGVDASLSLVYNRVVYDAKYFKTSTQPMRAPSSMENKPDVMVLNVVGDSYGDRVHILSRGDFSEQFEDGWDGRKIEGDIAAPMLAVVKESGEMAVAAIPTVEERYLTFRAGQDSIYTFSFNYDGDTVYLYDLVAQQSALIKTGNIYTFEARNTTPLPRFLITSNPPKIPTDIETTGTVNNRPIKYLENDHVYIFYNGTIFDITGKRVTPLQGKEGTQ